MSPHRFVPRLDLLEPRETPATNLTPEQVLQAAAFADLFFTGTSAALEDQSFIRQVGNRAPTQALAATIVAQAPALQDVLLSYAVRLGEEKAAAAPVYAEFFDEWTAFYLEKANFARISGLQAQQVSGLIDGFNAADAARAAQAGRTGGTTGSTTGTAGVNPFGVNTGTANTLPTPGTNGGTTQTTTPPAGTTNTGTPGSGTTFGDGPGAGSTTGSSTTGTTPTQSSGVSPGTPDSATP